MYDWTTDARMLAAGNARGLPGGDPMAMAGSPAGPTDTVPAASVLRVSKDMLQGDLSANARKLGVSVTSLVRARAEMKAAGQ